MTCKNCNAEFSSNFCPDCGQKKDIHKITVGHVFHDFLHSITHADKGFLLLVKELITRPGLVAREYMEGKRKKYFNPLSFLVLTSALFAYIAVKTGYMDSLTNSGGGGGGRMRSETWREVFQIARDSGKWLTLLLMVPLYALLSRLFFLRKPFNYAEHFVLHALIYGEAIIFRTVFNIPMFLIAPSLTSANLLCFEVVFLVMVVLAYRQFFEQHIVWLVLKAILIRIFFLLLFWFLIYFFVLAKHLVI